MKKQFTLTLATWVAAAVALVVAVVLGLFVSWKLGVLAGVILIPSAIIIGAVLLWRNARRVMKNPSALIDEAAPMFKSMDEAADKLLGSPFGEPRQRSPFPAPSQYGPYGMPPVPPVPPTPRFRR